MITSLQIGQNKIALAPITGSNSNGSYQVQTDGTCEQYGEFSIGVINGYSAIDFTINLPLEMNDSNYYVYRVSQHIDGGYTGQIRQVCFSRYVNKLLITIHNDQTDATRNTTTFQWRIKGKVKESVRKQLFGE